MGDLLDALAESEVSCLRSRVDDAIYDAMTQEPALAFATISQFLTTSCIETDRETDIAVALFAEAVGGLPAETEWCIGDEITENYGDGPFKPLSLQPLYMNCLNEEQFFELSVSELAGKAGGVDDDARDCLRQVLCASFGAASELQSGNPQDGIGITIAFREAAIYGCLGNDQVAIVAGPDVTISDSSTECLRNLYTREFPKLYNDIGPRIFGSSLDLTPQELAPVESFRDSRAECHVSPAVTDPTPDAPAPTLRPGVHTEPPSTIESNSSFKDYIDSRGAHQCQGRRRSGWPLPGLPTRPNRTARLWQTNISPKQPVQRPEPESRIRHLQLYAGDPFREEASQVSGHREDPQFLEVCVSNIHLEQVVIRLLSGFRRRPENEQRPDSFRIHPFRRLQRIQDLHRERMLETLPP